MSIDVSMLGTLKDEFEIDNGIVHWKQPMNSVDDESPEKVAELYKSLFVHRNECFNITACLMVALKDILTVDSNELTPGHLFKELNFEYHKNLFNGTNFAKVDLSMDKLSNNVQYGAKKIGNCRKGCNEKEQRSKNYAWSLLYV